jgi:hypothetical protein
VTGAVLSSARVSLRLAFFNNLGTLSVLDQVPRVHPLRRLERCPADQRFAAGPGFVLAVRSNNLERAIFGVHRPALLKRFFGSLPLVNEE